jgi:hypothetical protein
VHFGIWYETRMDRGALFGADDLVFDQRRALHYSYRLAIHVSLLTRCLRFRRDRGRWVALAMASICADLVVGQALRGRRDFLYPLRLLVDTVDTPAWVRTGSMDASTTRGAVLVAIPHAVEAGYEIGASNDWSLRKLARAVAIPVVTTGAAVLVRRRRGRRCCVRPNQAGCDTVEHETSALSPCCRGALGVRGVPVPARSDHVGGALVSQVRPVVPRRRGTLGRTRRRGRPRQRLPVGPSLHAAADRRCPAVPPRCR